MANINLFWVISKLHNFCTGFSVIIIVISEQRQKFFLSIRLSALEKLKIGKSPRRQRIECDIVDCKRPHLNAHGYKRHLCRNHEEFATFLQQLYLRNKSLGANMSAMNEFRGSQNIDSEFIFIDSIEKLIFRSESSTLLQWHIDREWANLSQLVKESIFHQSCRLAY